MIKIYLCDDEDAVRHQIQTALEWKIFAEDYDMKVACSAAAARELLDAAESGGRGIYFLDIELKDGDWDGFRLGMELRRLDPHGTLVYITSYRDLAWRTFQYHLEAFDYIVKEPERIGPAAARCLEDFLGSLNELETQLGDRFVRIHRAYLVAADRIETVDLKRGRLWTGGHECLLSRAGKAELRRKLGGSP